MSDSPNVLLGTLIERLPKYYVQYGIAGAPHDLLEHPNGNVVKLSDLKAALSQQVAEVSGLRDALNDYTAVCACGCPIAEHENYGEDGESCEHDDHECMRTSKAVYALLHTLRGKLTLPLAPPQDVCIEPLSEAMAKVMDSDGQLYDDLAASPPAQAQEQTGFKVHGEQQVWVLEAYDDFSDEWRPTTRVSLNAESAAQFVEPANTHRPGIKHRATQYVAAAPPSQGWQPIETAPKDGHGLIVVSVEGEPIWAWWNRAIRRWEWADGWHSGEVRPTPTHWMPLPAPPHAANQE